MQFRAFKIWRSIILVLASTSLSICNAQIYEQEGIKLEFSEKKVMQDKAIFAKFMKTSDDNFGILWYTHERFWHLMLSTQVEALTSSSLHKPHVVFDIDGERVSYVNTYLLGNNSYLFYKAISKKPKKGELFYIGLEGKSLIPFENPVSISKMEWPIYEEYNTIKDIQSDNEKFIALYTLPTYKIDSSTVAGILTKYSKNTANPLGKIMVMGENMVKKWEFEFTIPKNELYYITDQVIDNSGNFYTLGKLYTETINAQNKDNSIFDFVVYAFNNNGKEKKEYRINFKNKFISNCQMAISDDNELICSGFYSENKISNLIGSFCIKIDLSTGFVLNSGFFPFDETLGNIFTPKEAFSKNIDEFELTDFTIQDDGGVLLIAEKRYTTTVSTQSEVSIVHKYGDLMIINFNPDCTLKSANGIEKNQSGGPVYYPGHVSYASIIKGEDIYLIYYETPNNLDKNDPTVIEAKKNKSLVLVAASIKPKDGLKFTILCEAKPEDILYDLKQALKLNDSELILYGDYSKNYSIAKITVK